MIPWIAAVALISDPVVASAASGPPPAGRAGPPASVRAASAPLLQGVMVTVECTARTTGQVDACRVLEETHPGLGFGAAAVALMNDAEAAPGPRDIRFAHTLVFTP